MKTSLRRCAGQAAVVLGCLWLGVSGCGKKTPPSGQAFKTSGRPAAVSVETNSFKQVSAYLDPGGSFYFYMGTAQWLTGLAAKIADWRQVLSALPNLSPGDRENLNKVFDVVAGLVEVSGVEEVSGVGASGILVEKGTYQNRFILHHYPGRNRGFLWTMFGQSPHALTGLDFLPETTALATFSDVDAALLWRTVQEQVGQHGGPDASNGLARASAAVKLGLGLDLDQLTESLDGEVGLVLTLDPEKQVGLPQPRGGKVEISAPALALVVKTKNDKLFAKVDQMFQRNKQVVKVEEGGLKMRTLALPFPIPMRPSVALSGEFFFLATTDQLVRDMVAVKNGDGQGLKKNREFLKIAKGLPLQGNRFTYLSPEVGRTIAHLLDTAAFWQGQAGRTNEGVEVMQRLLGGDTDHFLFSVAANTPEGWVIQSRGTGHPAGALLGPTAVAPAAIAASLVLPALARAKERAQTVNCVNNLKQIGLAARLHANDHGNVMPNDFETMKAELGSPKILICPGDKSKTAPSGWAGFNFADASYVIVSPGATNSDPQMVYARCPIHGTTCLMDGSVQQQRQPFRTRPRPRER